MLVVLGILLHDVGFLGLGLSGLLGSGGVAFICSRGLLSLAGRLGSRDGGAIGIGISVTVTVIVSGEVVEEVLLELILQFIVSLPVSR
jgi:hypothetical protein